MKSHVQKVSSSLIKLATAASGNFGTDCVTHAEIGRELLKSLGVKSDLVVGESAWRVGEGDGDIILHAKMPGMVYQGPNAVPYHCWLEAEGGKYIIDFTTYQIPEKALILDRLDGGHTNVAWHPDYLIAKKNKIHPLQAVIQGGSGLFYYKKDAQLHQQVMEGSTGIDPDDLRAAMIILNNPDIVVKGPRDFGGV